MSSKNYGPAVSGYLDPENRSWETTVYQSGKAVLDTELNLTQDAEQSAALVLQRKSFPSGWISDDFLNTPLSGIFNGTVTTPDTVVANTLWAHVNGWILPIRNTEDNTGLNSLDLGAGPSGVGDKRTDLVILEVWRRLLAPSPSTTGKSGSGRIWRDGNVKIASADDVSLNYADDILDGTVGTETTKRVQIQYRLRVIQGVDLFTYPFGINDPTVLAYSVPVTAAAPDGVATAFTYTNQSGSGDAGLWVAGDGNPANTIGSVDGYIYALPAFAVFRRNTSAFDRNANHNGGDTYPGPSDRPDGYFSDIVEEIDVYDLRTGTAPTGWDLQEVLQKNLNFLFENENQTEIGTTLIGGGVDGHTTLYADEIGVSNVNGGDGVTTGDTPGAEFIGEFDSVRRVFSDRAVYETIVVQYQPNSPGVSPGGANWTVGATITVSPSALPIWPYASTNWAGHAPSGVSIVDVTKVFFSSSTAGKLSFESPYNLTIQGLGGMPQGALTLTLGNATDPTTFAALTNETLYVTLLVAYPPGVGLSKTPTEILGDNATVPTVQGVYINNPGQLPATNPIYFDELETPTFIPANREVRLEYNTVAHTFSLRPTTDTSTNYILNLPERPIDGSVSITINAAPYGGAIAVDGYTVTIDPVLVGGELVAVTYESVRALPQNDEQLTVYYQARMPQTVREFLLPSTLDLTSRYVSQNMYVLTAGSGSEGQAYPFPLQYVQTGGVYPGSGGTFSGDHEMDGDVRVSVAYLYVDTGFMQLPVNVPIVPSPNAVQFGRDPGDSDIEGRTYYKTATGYGFLAVGATLSDPKKHKNLVPLLCELPADEDFGAQGQLVLVLLSRWAEFDDSNSVGFDSTLANNYTTASVYRLKGNLLSNRRV